MPQSEARKFYFQGKLFRCPEGVYLPSDDSYLLTESVEAAKGMTAIDMGCGSGIQTLNLLFAGAGKVIALDINEKALETIAKNCGLAGFHGKIDARISDLFSACNEKADLIVFNPPYLETEAKKFPDLDGGKMGRELLDRFLTEMPAHLNKGGKCYFLQTDLNGYAATERKIESLGMELEVVARKRLFFEELTVYRCWRREMKSF